jgi:hypothetical protein
VHKLSGESASVIESAVNDWYPVLAGIVKKYAPRDVYNADESALYYISYTGQDSGGEG